MDYPTPKHDHPNPVKAFQTYSGIPNMTSVDCTQRNAQNTGTNLEKVLPNEGNPRVANRPHCERCLGNNAS